MKVHDLQPAPGSKKRAKRVARGSGGGGGGAARGPKGDPKCAKYQENAYVYKELASFLDHFLGDDKH